MSEKKERTRIITWDDPQLIVQGGKGLSGIEWLRAVQEGKLPMPPVAALLGMDLAEVEEGRVVFTLELAEFHYNPYATVHGGITTTLLDSAMTCAVQSVLPLGTLSTTLDLTTHFLRPMTIKTG